MLLAQGAFWKTAHRKAVAAFCWILQSPGIEISAVVGNDRLSGELQRIALDATVCPVERGFLALTVTDMGAD